jgi:hypothetical protein
MPVPIELHSPWRKSSFSGGDSNCVEIAFGTWRKSSFTGDANCVEIAHSVEAAAIRDSKHPDGPMLTVPASAYQQFVAASRGAR